MRHFGIILVVLAVGHSAHAASPRAYRIHPLQNKLARKLAPGAQKNLGGLLLVTYPNGSGAGSGVLVANDGKGHGLMLTNFHVAREMRPGAEVRFMDRTLSPHLRMVAADRDLDYTLLQIEIPPGAPATPLTLASRAPRSGEPLYAMGAGTLLNALPGRMKLTGSDEFKARMDDAAARGIPVVGPTITSGIAKGGQERVTIEGGEHVLAPFQLSIAPGSSGGGVFSKDHKLLALVVAGDDGNHGFGTSIEAIRDHLREKLTRGEIDPRSLHQVDTWLEETTTPAKRMAAAPKTSRLHPIVPEFARRLAPETRKNLFGLVHIQVAHGSGTGVIVSLTADGKALMLTNQHVAAAMDTGASVNFADGSQSPSARVLSRDPVLDYALLEVVVPKGSLAAPVESARRALRAGEPAYSVGAGTLLSHLPDGVRLGGTPSTRARIGALTSAGEVTAGTISSGVTAHDPMLGTVSGNANNVFWQGFKMVTAPGSSGGGIFSKDHKLSALIASGNPEVGTTSGPSIEDIRSHVAESLARGDIDPSAAAHVRAWVTGDATFGK